MKRLPGPLRHLYLRKNVTATLASAVDEEGLGGLKDRFRDEMREHLAELAELRAKGTPMEVTVFWDYENMQLERVYRVSPYDQINNVLRWMAGVLDAPVTSIEAVEFTRHGRTPQSQYLSGEKNYLMTLREMGGVVHRAWPRMTDAADVVLLDRMRTFLDRAANGGSKRIMCLMSGDKGFWPMLQAAQSEGVTIVQLSPHMEGHYFPGGCNFTVPFHMPHWLRISREILNRNLDIFRPEENWTLEQGPPRWHPGTVELRHEPKEELDRRVLHDFLNKNLLMPARARFNGQWRRAGLRLNDTLAAALQRALERTGTMGTRTGRLPPEAYEAVKKDLQEFKQGSAQDTAAVFWNFENMRLSLQGPEQKEMAARTVRWFQGFLGMPVNRVEVSRYVEPWERIGSSPQDWLFAMKNLGMVIHRVWPPRAEMTNMILTRSVGTFAKVAAARGADTESGSSVPRLICVFSEDLFFDEQMRNAQRAGISAMWFGPEERAIYYPANSEAKVRLNILGWTTLARELSIADVNPFLPGAWTPDAPPPRYQKTPIPVDLRWGKPEELELENTPLQIPKELLESKVGIGF